MKSSPTHKNFSTKIKNERKNTKNMKLYTRMEEDFLIFNNDI